MTEHDLQRAVSDMLTALLAPGVVYFSIDHAAAASARTGAMRVGRGVKPGIPDMMVFWSGSCLPIELKVGRGRLSPAQIAMHSALAWAGSPVAVCRSVDDVIAACIGAGVPMRGRLAA